jgi:hypothetical protein
LPGRRIKHIRERRDASQCEIENDDPHRSNPHGQRVCCFVVE